MLRLGVLFLFFFAANGAEQNICQCGDHNCQCCTGVAFKIPLTGKHVNFTACLAFGLDFETETAELRLQVNNKVLADKNFTIANALTNPLEICGSYLTVALCLDLVPKDHTKDTLTECPHLKCSIAGATVCGIDFPCFTVHDTQKASQFLRYVPAKTLQPLPVKPSH